jgi:hypothetical protein
MSKPILLFKITADDDEPQYCYRISTLASIIGDLEKGDFLHMTVELVTGTGATCH